MKRLDTVLPEWTRVMWASERAIEVWKPRVQAIVDAWSEIEKWSVVDGVRPSCLLSIGPNDLPELTCWAVDHQLVAIPLSRVGGTALYSATSEPPGETGWSYRVALCQWAVAAEWSERWHGHQNDDAIGALLGFPECCRRFFGRIWIEEKYLDTTWPMAEETEWIDDDKLRDHRRLIRVAGFDSCNILLRWLGVRAVPHLPCSFECPETVKVANEFAQVGRDHGFDDAIEWTAEMLSWPIEWSALHGIAEIKTPILKISSRTDMTVDKHVVQREGSIYPVEGSDGLVFPYRKAADQVQLTKTPAFARAFETDPPESKSEVELITLDTWSDNGFSSLEAMNDAHGVLLDATPFAELKPGAVVLDLGCGNAELLARLGDLVPNLELIGIEADGGRCRRAGTRRNGRNLVVYLGSMFDPDLWTGLRPELVYFMPGRLLELRDAGAQAKTLRGLLRLCECAVFYAYGDWIEKEGGILDLLHRAELVEGWEKVGTVATAPNAQAILARAGVRLATPKNREGTNELGQ